MNFVDLSGQKIGRLTVLKRVENKSGRVRWLCKCDCGNEITAFSNNLTRKHTMSCGCYNKDRNSEIHSKENNYDLSGEYGIGYTSKGKEFYFDLEDYKKIKDYCWYIDTLGYVRTNLKDAKKSLLFHILIMNPQNGTEVDHIYDKRNDNRKSQLQICTHRQNNLKKQLIKSNKSNITGVFYIKNRGKWLSSIRVNGKSIYLGIFKEKDEAIFSRLKAEKEYFGDFAPQKHLFEQYGV